MVAPKCHDTKSKQKHARNNMNERQARWETLLEYWNENPNATFRILLWFCVSGKAFQRNFWLYKRRIQKMSFLIWRQNRMRYKFALFFREKQEKWLTILYGFCIQHYFAFYHFCFVLYQHSIYLVLMPMLISQWCLRVCMDKLQKLSQPTKSSSSSKIALMKRFLHSYFVARVRVDYAGYGVYACCWMRYGWCYCGKNEMRKE